MRQLKNLKIQDLNIVFILVLLLLTGCSASKFQASNSNFSSLANPVENVVIEPVTPEVIVKPSATCELSAPKTKLNIGDHIDFKLSTNFEIPKDAQKIWSGKSFDSEFVTTKQEDVRTLMSYGLSFYIPAQAEIHKRQITIKDGNGAVICQSNLLKVEFLGEIKADKICTDLGGQLTGTESDTCKVNSWTLYRAMLAKGVITTTQPIATSGMIGMGDPSAIYCNSIKGTSSSDGMCSLDKYNLWYKSMGSM